MDVERGKDSGSYTVRFADTAEFVDTYTRQLLSGRLFLPLEPEPEDAAGSECSAELELPPGAGTFRLDATLRRVRTEAPRGLELALDPLPDELRSAIEQYLTALLRGEPPDAALPAPLSSPPSRSEPAGPASRNAEDDTDRREPSLDRGADAALAYQEEATGRAADGRAIQAQLREMSHGDRIRLALSGGKAARAALIRNPQPTYHPYVVQNPRITPAELAAMARNPNVSPEALRLIAGNAQHMADPTIRLHIVKNPKTDVQIAQKFLPRLSQSQIRQLARSDDVRPQIKAAAVRLVGRSGR